MHTNVHMFAHQHNAHVHTRARTRRQYAYVLQSLTLWREISTDMFKLWTLAENDMLREGNNYRLCDTGQGLNRVQVRPPGREGRREGKARQGAGRRG